jgi:hypothetical protein
MSRVHWWFILVFISLAIIALDIVTGPYLMFPITFVIPVGLAAWHLGPRSGLAFAFSLVGCSLFIATTLKGSLSPLWLVVLNASIRFIVLSGIALILAKVVKQKRALQERIKTLEGILPICMFCKKIRRPDGGWEQIESYVSNRSAAQFSHSLCNECARVHYGHIHPSHNHDTEPGAPPDERGK